MENGLSKYTRNSEHEYLIILDNPDENGKWEAFRDPINLGEHAVCCRTDLKLLSKEIKRGNVGDAYDVRPPSV